MIENVIMDQRGGVNHFRDDGDHALALLGLPNPPGVDVEGVPNTHRDHRPESLACSVEIVFRHLSQLGVNLAKL